ncbi:Uncharacterised protein [Campylobacter hyointestinalis subsp. hyointestinalis]|uniref:Uncharacterized protein n=1 Tax=Campylobacter hyointestinalis subsp. hyointestinalis TaxID=91352 RepID=A0A0S4SV88_CAMHY|nr:hypothetical protein [Campylobacter hyointestinalis]CUU90095.1 Uncharacterised protein [Campylobacter hyointestinalis subsp. hyointestinalis]
MKRTQLINRFKIGQKVLFALLFLVIAFGSTYIWYFGIFINENVIGVVKAISIINIILLCVLIGFIEYESKLDKKILNSFKKLEHLDTRLVESEVNHTNTKIKIFKSISSELSYSQKLLKDGKIEAAKMGNKYIIAKLKLMVKSQENLLKDIQSAKTQSIA